MGIKDLLFLAKGAVVTLELFGAACFFGGIAGFFLGIARSSHRMTFLRWIAAGYIEIFRSTPLLVMILVVFFGLSVVGFEISRFWASVVVLSLYSAAYLGEILRAGIQSIRKEQWEASASLGMKYMQILRYVIIPQAMRVITPSFIGFLIGLVKDTALVSVIGTTELTLAARRVSTRTYMPLVSMGTAAMIYFIICYPLDRLGLKLESRTS
jgi:polar amino acid transport system permease protein